MAFVGLVSGVSGDLNVAAFDFGYFDDIVLAVEDVGGTVKTYEGNDTIDFSRILSSGIQWTVYCGSGNDTFIGGGANETVHDGSGNDNISLDAGNDAIVVGTGNDVYNGGSGDDTIFFTWTTDDGFGSTFNSAGIVIDLAVKTAQDFGVFGVDKVVNFENVAGGNGNDKMSGDGNANQLVGLDGNDVLIGRNGNDTLYGGNGKDIIVGGKGADHLYDIFGSDGVRDIFRYLDVSDSNAADGVDEIIYFVGGGGTTGDRIDLKAIDANASVTGDQKFQFIGTNAFDTTAKGQVRYDTDGTDTFVFVDTDTDTDAEMMIVVRGLTSLAAGDFIL